MSTRPNNVPLLVIWPSPLNSVKTPLTFIAPHIVLLLNVIVDWSESSVQTPTDSGFLRSSVTVDMSPPGGFLFVKGIQHAIELFVDVGVQPVGSDSDDDGNQHRVRSPIAGGTVQECCGRPSRRSRSTSCVALVHRVGYSIGYSSGAPRLRHVHDVRFRLFMRRRYRGPRRIHSHRPRRGSPSAVARRAERRDHRSISGRYLHSDRKSVTNAGDLQNVTVNIGSPPHGFTVVEREARAAMRRGGRRRVFGATGQTVVAAPTELSRGPADGWT